MSSKTQKHYGAVSDLRGVVRLIVDAVAGVTGIVEDMHRNIAGVSPIVGRAPSGGARGISGLAYRSVRGVTRAVGFGLDAVLAQAAPLFAGGGLSPRREAVLAALNGVLGDHLAASDSPLAIPIQFRRNGRPLALDRQALAADTAHPAGNKLLVLVHGLCMNDLQWKRQGRDHGAALARDLGYSPIYLHYNSGRHISSNGREFAELMERLLREWPAPVSELVIVGHSMGGLVSRSACHYARQTRQTWPRRLKKLVFLGTPHHGAPLERAGSWVDILFAISPYTAPFARLGRIRSAGIKDLRYGNVLDEDWKGRGRAHAHDPRKRLPLPKGVQCLAIAATRQAHPGAQGKRLPGDGLVPVKSALGQHDNPALALPIPASRQVICYGHGHLDLLGSVEVYEQLRNWLAEG